MPDPLAPLAEPPQLERYGWPELVYAAAPAAGAALTIPVDGNYVIQPLAVYFRLVTDANVPDRFAKVDYLDAAGNIFLSNIARTDITASVTTYLSFSRWAPELNQTGEVTMTVPLAATYLVPTWKISVTAYGLQAGDQIDQVRILWQKFHTFGDR